VSKLFKRVIKGILFDFDGVLSTGRFYSAVSKDDALIIKKVRDRIFSSGRDSLDLVDSWMRGEKTYKDINKLLAEEMNLKTSFLNKSLVESVKAMVLNKDLVDFAQVIRCQGIKVAIFTDNMDVFEKILVPRYVLRNKFDFIFSSSTYRKLKLDDKGEFLDFAIAKLEVEAPEVLLIDDSTKIRPLIEERGGLFYWYRDYRNEFPKFKSWFERRMNFYR